MKKYFITGLVLLLPMAVSLGVVIFVVNFLTKPFVGSIEQLIVHYPWYAKFQTPIHFILQLLLLCALFFFTVLIGFLARAFIFRSLLNLYEYIMHRIPIVKTIYKTTQQIIKTIFGSSSKTFKQVVMVPFPVSGAYAIGLVSSPPPPLCQTTLNHKLVTVFVPTTPNPTSGYLMMYNEEEVVYLDMKIEDAFKYIISCGVVSPGEIDPLANGKNGQKS
ncbi:MAG: hypothetical protein K940chlam2_01748 [Chlamydiae bacterium]|nr:hypothetical protein [Chlamydiota bacterium]